MKKNIILLGILVIALAIILGALLFIRKSKQELLSNSAQAAKLDILTDKVAYNHGELVKIMISNYADNPIAQETTLETDIKAVNFLGENYGVGLIEKYTNDTWNVIEPVWRCNNSCFLPCDEEHSINPSKRKIFTWDQTVMICDYINKTDEKNNAGAGKYRISSGFWLEDEQRSEIIYSNEFVIR